MLVIQALSVQPLAPLLSTLVVAMTRIARQIQRIQQTLR
jgi:hypothetical protein